GFTLFRYYVSRGEYLIKLYETKLLESLLVPSCPNQPWYPIFLRLSTSKSLILGPNKSMLLSPINFPKYNATWDPALILNTIKERYPLESLSAEKLVKKLVILMILASEASRIMRSFVRKRKNREYLILTFRKTHRKISTQCISRWIKDFMKISGINTEVFKSHSTRHTSTSAVYRKGLSIDQIKNTVSWTKKSEIFAKFYNRPLEKKIEFLKTLCEADD
ncbi:hypothetical protein ILUMI_13570, partial [Ignelater luminosus]